MMYENADLSIMSPSRTFYQYETIPIRSFYENSQNLVETNELNRKDPSIVPSFQQNLPIILMIILGSMEILSGLAVLVMEILIFDIAIGLWCGSIYLIAGIATLILVILTDRERHQTSTVLILQFIALLFAIAEICLHTNFYQKRCTNKFSEELFSACQILFLQTITAALVVCQTIFFVFIYVRLTILVLKQPHGTFNLSNALNITC